MTAKKAAALLSKREGRKFGRTQKESEPPWVKLIQQKKSQMFLTVFMKHCDFKF